MVVQFVCGLNCLTVRPGYNETAATNDDDDDITDSSQSTPESQPPLPPASNETAATNDDDDDDITDSSSRSTPEMQPPPSQHGDGMDENNAASPLQSLVLCRDIVPVIPRHAKFSIGCGKDVLESKSPKRVSLTLLNSAHTRFI